MVRRRKPTQWEEEMGMRLQQLRKRAGLSQRQLADAAGVPVGNIRHWEHGRRTPLLDAAARLAQALSVSIDELAGVGQAEAQTPPAAKKTARKRKG